MLWNDWNRARHVSLVLCRLQQRLEGRLMVTTGIPVLTVGKAVPPSSQTQSAAQKALADEYSIAREAEVFAMTEALKLQDAIPEVAASSLAGIIAKLEMIVGADRDIGDPTDFPWPHIASVLRDLRALAGDLPPNRLDRSATRSSVARHWKASAKLVAALKEEEGGGERHEWPVEAAASR
jgi:hypothetical protein